jgi:hypothetical protein
MRKFLWPVLLLAALLALRPAASSPQTPASCFEPQPADYSAITLLVSARTALGELATEEEASERRLRCAAAISALVGLYQLHGCRWALPSLRAVYDHPDCPDLHLGYSADGRISVRIEPLDLHNPAFENYTILLCTMRSNSALDLTADQVGVLTVELLDQTQLTAQPLSAQHELWPQLDRLAHTFKAPAALPSGAGIGFKQLFAVSRLNRDRISAVSLRWGDYQLTVPYYENEVGS